MNSTESNFRLSQVGQICVTAHDLDRAVAFYRDKLGIKFLFQVPKMAFFDCGGVGLMLGVPEKPEFDHPSSIIYFKVEKIRQAYETLASRGVEFLAPPHFVAPLQTADLWMAFFRDCEQNVLALMSEEPRR